MLQRAIQCLAGSRIRVPIDDEGRYRDQLQEALGEAAEGLFDVGDEGGGITIALVDVDHGLVCVDAVLVGEGTGFLPARGNDIGHQRAKLPEFSRLDLQRENPVQVVSHTACRHRPNPMVSRLRK
jgi:hypothetical protein